MQKQILEEFLDGKLSTKDFLEGIRVEVEVYKKGDFRPIVFNEDKKVLYVSRDRILRILQLYITGEIDEIVLNYICDVFDLYEYTEYENAVIENVVERIANHEIHGGLNKKIVSGMIVVLA